MRVALALLCAAALAGCSGGGRAAHGGAKRIATAGASRIEIDADNGAVAIAAAPATDAVVVTQAGSATAPSALPVSWTRRSGRLIVTIGGGVGTSQIPFVATGGVAYRIRYPAALPLYVRAFGGDVRLSDSRAPVQVTDAQGTVTVQSPRGSVSVDSGGGDVSARDAGGALDLATDRGRITATLAHAWQPHAIRFESGTGDIALSVPPGFRGHVDASAGSGTVRDALTPAARRAKAPPVWLYTADGSIAIGFSPGT